MFMASRPRWDATPVAVSSNPATSGDFLSKVAVAEAKDEQANYIKYQRSQREQVYTGTASQPVGGRMRRQFDMHSRREEWTDKEELAFQKAFNKSTSGRPAALEHP